MATWRSTTAALAVATVMLTAGCGGSGTEGPSDSAPSDLASPESLASSFPTADARSGPAGQLTLANDPNIGPILTDSTGFTLYRLSSEGALPAAPKCEGDCAKTWPPVPAEEAEPPAGLNSRLLGSVRRADGSRQLTFAGLPMYRYSKDAKPGQVNGDKVDDTWFAGLPKDRVPGLNEALNADTGADVGDEPAIGDEPSTGNDTDESGEEAVTDDLPGLSVADDPDLGKIVVDARGRTLYRYVKDTDWPMTTACTGKCLDKWKPASVVGKNDAKGIDPKLVIPFNRPDGIKQQTLNCWPLYWFTGETPGEIKGQGLDGEWFAVTPDGSLVRK
jgi:predicted lipoprotein with Yx(FWY)xxD motif